MLYLREDLYSIMAYVPDNFNVLHRASAPIMRDRTKELKARSAKSVRELALCNPWDYFCTITISERSIGSQYDYALVAKSLTAKFNQYKKFIDNDFKFLIVPELRDNGSLHFHGFVKFGRFGAWRLNGKYRKLWHNGRDNRGNFRINQWFLEYIGINRFRKISTKTGAPSERDIAYCVKYATKADIKIISQNYRCSRGLARYKRWRTESPFVLSVVESYKRGEYKTEYGKLYYLDKNIFYDHIKRLNVSDLIEADSFGYPFSVQNSIDLSEVNDMSKLYHPAYHMQNSKKSCPSKHFEVVESYTVINLLDGSEYKFSSRSDCIDFCSKLDKNTYSVRFCFNGL